MLLAGPFWVGGELVALEVSVSHQSCTDEPSLTQINEHRDFREKEGCLVVP